MHVHKTCQALNRGRRAECSVAVGLQLAVDLGHRTMVKSVPLLGLDLILECKPAPSVRCPPAWPGSRWPSLSLNFGPKVSVLALAL